MGTPGPREMCDYNWCDCENVTKFLGDLVYTARVAEDEIRKRYTPAEARALIVMCTKHHGLHRPLGYCYDEEKCKKIKEDVHDFWSIIFGFKKYDYRPQIVAMVARSQQRERTLGKRRPY